MIILQPLAPGLIPVIAQWPPYDEDMAQMDYALREKGWLEEFMNKPQTYLYGAHQDGEMIGFSMLILTAPGEAEFRIALRADRTGAGLGGDVTRLTLQEGFERLELSRIHLIVRTNNLRGINLYRRLGFIERGTLRKEIQGTPVDFITMDLKRSEI